MLKNTKDIIKKKIFFYIYSYIVFLRYSCPIRLVPTYILPTTFGNVSAR